MPEPFLVLPRHQRSTGVVIAKRKDPKFLLAKGSTLLLTCLGAQAKAAMPLVAGIAQLVEQWTENPRVGGSSPPPGIVGSCRLVVGRCPSG